MPSLLYRIVPATLCGEKYRFWSLDFIRVIRFLFVRFVIQVSGFPLFSPCSLCLGSATLCGEYRFRLQPCRAVILIL